MKKIMILPCIGFLWGMITTAEASPVTSEPANPTVNDSIIIYFDATKGNQGLKDFAGPVYAHTGVLTDESISSSEWKYVVTNWGEDTPETQLSQVETNLWKLVIGYPRVYYNIPENVKVTHLAFVFRSSQQSGGGYLEGKDVDNKDIFLELYEPGITAQFITPTITESFQDPRREPLFMTDQDTLHILGTSVQLFTETVRTELFINGTSVSSVNHDTLSYTLIGGDYTDDLLQIDLIAEDMYQLRDTASFIVIKNPGLKEAPRPEGLDAGITVGPYGQSVTFSLFAPYKDFVYLIGDFNDWMVLPEFEMFRDYISEDEVWYWITVPVDESKEYGFQYLIDGEIRIADPYTQKILDPWNDPYIPESVYPGLKPYPKGKTREIVSTFTTEMSPPFNWTDTAFVRPAREKLVIYELLIRDFLADHHYETLIDTLPYLKKLGVNAIELMPISEFEGNSSWGYNPSFYFAPDKYYGTDFALKRFINTCHLEGIAVIMDMVLNHSYGQSPMVRMYWNSAASRPSEENPWFNEVSPNPDYSWGFDFNHESPWTQAFVDSVLAFWIQEYHVDGYRLDFTKGFTNTAGDPGYDVSRINLIKRLGNVLWQKDSTAYLILEHWADNSEEQTLANEGFMLWGNVTHVYQEASMGYESDFSWGFYESRGWSEPRLVSYMESHDEERIMFKNLSWGKVSGDYSIQEINTALNRVKLISAFFYTIPGPKMLWQFGELGYDVSIDTPCRVCEKPIRWDYYHDAQRKNLFKTTAALIRLRLTNPLFYSGNTQVEMDTGGMVKTLTLTGSSMRSVIVGNFDVVEKTADVTFPRIGVWYDYFSGDSLILGNLAELIQPLTLAPGEFHIYTDKKQPLPEPGILTRLTEEMLLGRTFELFDNYPNPFNGMTR
ncbi:MAG: alpha-amylase, partial [Candidatus Marinimicrobia bacterium]|nr:alpha-amylase [Candidatus Neomarinimicrobiota bacterium]